MFYSQTLLSRKGSLKAVWVAAYCHKRLKKDQVAQTDISSSVDDIVLNAVTVTYRVLGYLLLGVVRIYSKKVEYLFDDCQDVFIKINTYAFSEKNKLPKEALAAPYHSITLPDKFELDAFDLEIVEDVGRDTLKPHDKQITLEDAWEVARNVSFSDKYHQEESTAYFAVSTAYAPVDDIFLSLTMDIDTGVGKSHDLSGLEASTEFQSTQLPQEEPPDLEMFSADEPLTPRPHFDEAYNLEERIKLTEMTPSGPGETHVPSEWDPVFSPVDKTTDNSKSPNISGQLGASTPEFMVIPTPARKEQQRRSRKRKHLFDEVIVLSNEVVRQTLHDSSRLVCKRRKAPETALDAWRASMISNLCHDFLKPLILGSSWLENLFYKKNNTPQNVQVDKGSIKSGAKVFETSCNYSEQHGVAEEISVDQSASVGLAKCTTTRKSDKMGPTTSDGSARNKLSDSDIGTRDLGLNLTDEEIGLHDEEHQSPDGWSVRTRKVAKYLADSFRGKKKQGEKEVLNMAPMLEGRTRKENARLFYELLVLKSHDVINVKQETPYGDIVMLPAPRL